MYSYIKKNILESYFPNLKVAIYVTLAVTNCTAGRFPALKRIKSKKISTMDEEKLNSLVLLCMQSDVTLTMDFIEINYKILN